ncbi:hypothetical protein HDU98_002138 [Podochytrium sp. JEL0797]|nr:hypothetical protein HDU98_002138 [Podochytrium sp. JEL0797]
MFSYVSTRDGKPPAPPTHRHDPPSDSQATLTSTKRRRTHFRQTKPLAPSVTPQSHSHRFVKVGSANKVFASAWLDTQRILVASKCNALRVVDANTARTLFVIPPIRGYFDVSIQKWFHGATK